MERLKEVWDAVDAGVHGGVLSIGLDDILLSDEKVRASKCYLELVSGGQNRKRLKAGPSKWEQMHERLREKHHVWAQVPLLKCGALPFRLSHDAKSVYGKWYIYRKGLGNTVLKYVGLGLASATLT